MRTNADASGTLRNERKELLDWHGASDVYDKRNKKSNSHDKQNSFLHECVRSVSLNIAMITALEALNCSMNLEVWLQDRQTLSDCIDRSQIPVFPSSYISPHFCDICNGKKSVCFRK